MTGPETPLVAALRDEALADMVRLHLVSLLDTTQWCRFAYLRAATGISDDRLKRHFYVLRACGSVVTTRSTGGMGWARLTERGAVQRDAQFAALQDLLPAARQHATDTRAARPDWFTAAQP